MPTAPPSGSAKCLRFGHWLTLCTLNMHVLTYLLTNTLKKSQSPKNYQPDDTLTPTIHKILPVQFLNTYSWSYPLTLDHHNLMHSLLSSNRSVLIANTLVKLCPVLTTFDTNAHTLKCFCKTVCWLGNFGQKGHKPKDTMPPATPTCW